MADGARIILVTGGARSGKSEFAEKYTLAAAAGERAAYIATAEVFDEEMRFRVERHRARRGRQWETFEAPTEERLLPALVGAGEYSAVLLDCLSMYLSNFLCEKSEEELKDEAALYEESAGLIDHLIAGAREMRKTRALVIVTSETGLGIVPENHLARLYRDLLGLASQRLAREAAAVYFVAAGQAVDIKALALTPEQAVRNL